MFKFEIKFPLGSLTYKSEWNIQTETFGMPNILVQVDTNEDLNVNMPGLRFNPYNNKTRMLALGLKFWCLKKFSNILRN